MASTTSVFPLVTLLLQHSKVVHAAGYATGAGRFFGGEEESKSMQPVLERVPLPPCCIYTSLKCKRVFGRWTKAVLISLLSYPWADFYSHSPLG